MAKTKNTPEINKDINDADSIDINESINEKESGQTDNDTRDTEQNESLSDQLSAEKDKYLRLAAEYDNFRKRSAKEREMTYSNARTDVISKLLPVYDNLERALKMECADESFYKGVEMIMTQLTETLGDMGVQIIPAIGQPFDPNRHNAVMSIENPDLGENIIAEEYQKGFMLGDRVIRFSTVVVAN
ncbi:MAG: nucleotide exchange factor GrpE [Oscillospiraceae bacterium]|nr:nucleotide exchange factor GrpE [Oscillospiraceae bacterium]